MNEVKSNDSCFIAIYYSEELTPERIYDPFLGNTILLIKKPILYLIYAYNMTTLKLYFCSLESGYNI